MTVANFLELLSSRTGIPASHIKCKHIEETKQTRVDRLIWNKEYQTLPPSQWVANTLRDVKVIHNGAFMIEMKDETDIEDD